MVNPSDLRGRRARLAAELSKLDELIGALDAYANEFAPDLLVEASVPTKDVVAGTAHFVVKPTTKRLSGGGRVSPMVDATADVVSKFLNESNQPMMLSQIHDAVVAAGVPVPSNGDPRNVVGTRLHRSGMFRTITGKGWWFKDRAVPTVNQFAPHGADENGAPIGSAESAPEAGEVAPSSVDNRPGFRLVS